MLCGLSRLSYRAFIATAIFFSTAVATVFGFNRAGIDVPPTNPSVFGWTTILLLQFPLLAYRYIIPATVQDKWYKPISSFFIAVHFAFGLALAGMLQPSKIQNFLSLPMSSSFDPSLAFVAVGALFPNLIAWTTKLKHAQKPWRSDVFELPTKTDVDWRLVVGSVIWGFAWGWYGVCPGPGLVLEGAYVEQWRSIGVWVLGMTLGRLMTPA
jgi:uncharacterized protein